MSRSIPQSALISAYDKSGLESVVRLLAKKNIRIFATGGTKDFIERLGIHVTAVEDLTGFPSVFGGRVKTLHPKVFGGILFRRSNIKDVAEAERYGIAGIDMVIVNLYPFQDTVAKGGAEEDVIEQIDIGGVSLIRAAAKNHRFTTVISSPRQYEFLERVLRSDEAGFTNEERKRLAAEAFAQTAEYDAAIADYLSGSTDLNTAEASQEEIILRYGENPHQKAVFRGKIGNIFKQLHGKDLSYNNLLDLDAGLLLLREFDETAFVIIKHTNACGAAVAESLSEAYRQALSGDPVSAFGGVFLCNRPVDAQTAVEIDKVFFEILAAPDFSSEAYNTLIKKKNRILIRLKGYLPERQEYRVALNGVLLQDKDLYTESEEDLRVVTRKHPDKREKKAALFAAKIVKHLKSNAIVLTDDRRILGIGVGQPSRIDSVRQAIEKAGRFGADLRSAVMASDAFLPFADSVEEAYRAGIRTIVQPGGSVRDRESIDFCDTHDMGMIFTGIRHFKH